MTAELPAYLWAWLPNQHRPVVAGVITESSRGIQFTYAKSYLTRAHPMPLAPELPLQAETIEPGPGLTVAGAIRDAAPDRWGQRAILRHLRGTGQIADSVTSLSLITYLRTATSSRIGAFHVHDEPEGFVETETVSSLEALTTAVDRLGDAAPYDAEADSIVVERASVGGSSPKALYTGPNDTHMIAKMAPANSTGLAIRREAAAMRLAHLVDLDVASARLMRRDGRDLLLVRRFDRTPDGFRRIVLSMPTLLGLDEMFERYATYHHLAEVITEQFADPETSLRELFRRIVFNVAVGNTDDHARNVSAFWDGANLSLTPAYDICPQDRPTARAHHAMAIGRRDTDYESTFANCLNLAALYGQTAHGARAIVDEIVEAVREHWEAAAEAGHLTNAERDDMWQRQILNPFAFEGMPVTV